MTLSEYLRSEGLTLQQFGDRVGRSHATVSRWANDVFGVGARTVLDVEAATGGKVSRHDLRPDIFGPAPKKKRAA